MLKKLITDFFRVAVAGPTVDGREITSDDINQMAETYNPETYGARIWMEHLRGLLPDSLFPAYGDVVSAKAEDWKDPLDGKTKRALYVQLAPTPELVKANQGRQKVFFSIETIKDFAKSGKTYLGGLAVTDSPASLGTEMAAFSVQNREKLTGVPDGDRLFSVGIEADKAAFDKIEAEDEQKPERAGLFSKVRDLLTGQRKADDERFGDITQAVELLAQEVKDIGDRIAGIKQGDNADTYSQLSDQVGDLSSQLTDVTSRLGQLETSPETSYTQRPEASGGDGVNLTDC